MTLVNVRDGFHQPVINQHCVDDPGIPTIFAKEEEYGISLHWTNRVLDIDGNPGYLTQYSYIALKNDAIEWLTKNGRLPTAHLDQYFREISALNKQAKDIKELTAYNQA